MDGQSLLLLYFQCVEAGNTFPTQGHVIHFLVSEVAVKGMKQNFFLLDKKVRVSFLP